MFNAKTLTLISIKELHEDEILDIASLKLSNPSDPRNNLLVSCSRDKKVKSFKYIDEDIVEITQFEVDNLPVIGLGFIEEKPEVKLIYIDAESNLSLRVVKDNIAFASPVSKNLAPRKFYSLAVRDNKIAIGMDAKIQFGELKANNYWALMKSAGGNQTKMSDFVKLEIDETSTFVLASSWKSNDVHCIDVTTTRVMGTFSSGEPITCMKITPDFKYLITCSSRGCFYVWKLPKQIYSAMKFKARQNEMISHHPSLDNTVLTHIEEGVENSEDDNE